MKFTQYLIAGSMAAALQAGAVQFDFDTVYTGDTPGGTSPYARVTVLQAAPDVVSLKLEALGLTSTEFISKFSYNISGTASSAGVLAPDDETGGVGPSGYSLLASEFVDASLSFDASVSFPTAGNNGGAARFKDGESFLFTLTRPGLTVDDIDLDMMIHIQGITLTGGPDGSSKVIATPTGDPGPGTPVPDAGSTLVLLGLAGLGVAAARRR